MRKSQNKMFTVRKLYSVLKYGVSALLVFFVIGLLNNGSTKRNSTAESDVHQELLLAKEYLLEDIKLYEAMIAEDEARVVPGWGELGVAVNLRGENLAEGEASLKKNAINIFLSDRISLNRTLADYRDPKCRKVLYDAQLPSTSVIIIFHNEPYSVLLRTIWSVLNSCRRTKPWLQQSRFFDFNWTNMSKDAEFIGSPGSDPNSEFVYLKEIILVDDNSTLPELRGKLGYYIRTRFPQDLVKIIRLPNRVGLTRARLEGAKVAVADTMIFLDAHCEPSADWVRPLLQRIKQKRDTALVPLIDVINNQNFYYSTNGIMFQVGGFDFDGQFTWIDVSAAEKKRRGSAIAPTWSPTMAGGLFAIDRKYFWEIGSYDEQMDGWGGENLEMSFRIWQCGGTLETIPCSRVGHIFRAFHPYKFPGEKDTHGINTVRLAKVWMDDYADIFFLHRPDLLDYDVGDLTHRKVLREKLKCKPFQWYLDNIYKDKFIPTKNVSGYGRIMHPSKKYCIDTMQHEEEQSLLGVYPCHEKISMTQFFSITKKGELRTETLCAQIQYRRNKKTVYHVMMDKCHGMKRDQEWKLIPSKKNRFSVMHLKTGSCLDITGFQSGNLETKKCDNSSSQSWIVEFTKLNNFSDAKNPIAAALDQAGYQSEETSPRAVDKVDYNKPIVKEAKPDGIQGLKYDPEAQFNVIQLEDRDEIKGFKSRKLQTVDDYEDISDEAKHQTKSTTSTIRSVVPRRKYIRPSNRRNNGTHNRNDAQNAKRRAEHMKRKHHHPSKGDDAGDDKSANHRHTTKSKRRKHKDKAEVKLRSGSKRNKKVVDQETTEGEDKAGSVWKLSKTTTKPADDSEEDHTKKEGRSYRKHVAAQQVDSGDNQKPIKTKEEVEEEQDERLIKKANVYKKKLTPATISTFDVGKDSDVDAISVNDMASQQSAESRDPIGVDNNAVALPRVVGESTTEPSQKHTMSTDDFERYFGNQEEESYSVDNDNASDGKDSDRRKPDTATISSSSSTTTEKTRATRVVLKHNRMVYKKKDDSSYEDA